MSPLVIKCILVTLILWEALLCAGLTIRLTRLRKVPEKELEVVSESMSADDMSERRVPRFDNPATSVEEIHQRYAELAETDPKLAGELKYRDMLALHGK